ncbi:MAG TPA: RES family NAD+ phosphorylase [Ferruginibacter sp.]|nr:RES family NAD+ phosphorylase [Ferruginibacter sp.]
MIVYRISNTLYSNDLSGTGAKLMGGRWNSKGIPILYTSEHISLALLEMLVNTQFKDFIIPLDLLNIQVPETASLTEINLNKLKKGWVGDFGYTAFMGDEFIKNKQSLLLKVPSAVIHEEYNYLINPLHADFKKIKITDTRSFKTDERLFTI